uniref:EamA domain-containing protein n=1 Tax=Panagrellus redivivus TaxID=6233 RepID=A0A7E4UT07_PANRE
MFGNFDGVLQLLAAVILFGTMFVPIKQFDAGDGFYSQWIMSISMLLVGFGLFAYQQFTAFYPLAMLGGVFLSFGNLMTIPAMKRLGLALGFFIWSSTNCIIGWVITTFGLFGVTARPARNVWLTVAGLLLIFPGAVTFAFVKNQIPQRKQYGLPTQNGSANEEAPIRTEITTKDRLLGVLFAFIAGCSYSLNMIPIIYIQDNVEGATKDGLAYAFSQYSGLFITCTLTFLVYALFQKNEPKINSKISVPVIFSGACFAMAQAFTLGATAKLSGSITYPIVSTIPGCIAALWSIFYFREITGKRNLYLLGVAIVMILTVCVGLLR